VVSANTDETGSIAIRIVNGIFRIRAFIPRAPDTLAAELVVSCAIWMAATVGGPGSAARAKWVQNPVFQRLARSRKRHYTFARGRLETIIRDRHGIIAASMGIDLPECETAMLRILDRSVTASFAPFVYRLGRHPFTVERAVRFR
jgi:hypothetical protein